MRYGGGRKDDDGGVRTLHDDFGSVEDEVCGFGGRESSEDEDHA